MSEFKTLSVVERYAITVAVPMNLSLGGFDIKNKTILKVAEGFGIMRDLFDEKRYKVELDRARILLEYAHECGAQLDKIKKQGNTNKLTVTLNFESLESMLKFNNTMASTVERKVLSSW